MTEGTLKSVISLLLTADLPSEAWDRVRPCVVEILESARGASDPPELLETRRADETTDCRVDLHDDLRADLPYDLALEFLLGAYEPVLRDLLSVEPGTTWTLSALLRVDDSLAAFTVASPRIPASLNNLSNFRFEYFVVHNTVGESEADETDDPEGDVCNQLDA